MWAGRTFHKLSGRAGVAAAVNSLKAMVGGCCRPLEWKMLMAMEVENVAIRQQLTRASVQGFERGLQRCPEKGLCQL